MLEWEFTCIYKSTLLTSVICRLCDEFEEIAQKALTTPANTKELMELKAYVQKVESETMYALERKLVHAKTTLEFLIEHANFSPVDMRSNTNTFMWSDRIPSIIEEHRAIVAAKQTQFEEGLKVYLHILWICLMFIIYAYLVLTLCGLALRSTRMTRPRVQRTSPWRNPSLWI